MTTTVAPPPQPPPPLAAIAPSRRRAPARRAIRRWAWRLLRREWRQQILILALLTLAVAATTIGLGLVVNVQGSDQGQFGTADARIDMSIPNSAAVAADLAAARRRFGAAEAIPHANVSVPGSATPVDLRAQDPHGVYGKPMLHLVSGRYPVGADQAAVTAAVATIFDLKVGSTWTVNGRALHVVGIVENPKDLVDAFGLVAPGQISAPTGLTLLFDANAQQVVSFQPPDGKVQGVSSSGATSAQQQRNQALAVLLLATVGLIFIGLLCVAGFTVMAQRRLRALGMIAAIGATDRQVRRVMSANGAAVGIVGAGLGVVLGLVTWLALTPAFEQLVGHRYNPLVLPWWAVAAGVVLAILCSLAASWWPARAVARRPIVEALSGRPAPPQPAHRFALLGTVLAAAGFISLVSARGTNHLLIVVGVLATTAGMLLLAPLGIRALAAMAARAPVAVRLALRDLVRYQARSGAALAAASLAIGIAATIAVLTAAQQAHDHTLTGGNLPANQLIVWLDDPNNQGGSGSQMTAVAAGAGTVQPVTPNAAVVASARSTADAIARADGRGTVVELDVAADLTTPEPAGAPADSAQANLVRPITGPDGQQGWNVVTTPYVATPAVLSLYRIPTTDIAAGTDIVSSRRDMSGIELGGGFTSDFRPVTVQVAPMLANYSSAPNTLITPRAMAADGYTAEPVGWLVQTPHNLSSAQITDARQRAAAAGITTEVRTGPDDTLQKVGDYATGIGLLVALGVLAMTIGLIRSETAGDLRTLTAAGASGATRRMLNAASAGALALLGAILGTAAAYVALIAWHWHHVSYLDPPPFTDLAILIFGLPALAVAGAWLLGRTPTAISRRSLE
jgi:putative ABC transport system permease protein